MTGPDNGTHTRHRVGERDGAHEVPAAELLRREEALAAGGRDTAAAPPSPADPVALARRPGLDRPVRRGGPRGRPGRAAVPGAAGAAGRDRGADRAQLADEQAEDLEQGLGFLSTFLIVNTFSILVAQWTKELALMRALGASRRQVTGSVLLEALVVGTLVTAGAALLPARRAATVPPIAAMRDVATGDRSLRRQTISGAVLLLGGAVAMVLG